MHLFGCAAQPEQESLLPTACRQMLAQCVDFHRRCICSAAERCGAPDGAVGGMCHGVNGNGVVQQIDTGTGLRVEGYSKRSRTARSPGRGSVNKQSNPLCRRTCRAMVGAAAIGERLAGPAARRFRQGRKRLAARLAWDIFMTQASRCRHPARIGSRRGTPSDPDRSDTAGTRCSPACACHPTRAVHAGGI